MKLNISPNPDHCAGVPGGVNSVVSDHAIGFAAAGCEIGDEGLNIVHAIAQNKEIGVFHCHGLYPIGPDHFIEAYSASNDILLQNALKAKVTICISEFSANILRHKLHIHPIVTRNGIWTKNYKSAGDPKGPVLFPKATLDANAKADEIVWLSKNTPLPLLSIAKIPGISSLGQVSRDDFLKTLHKCSVYLGTTKENNSMASMEALISGVPIVGYDVGFNSEWLRNGFGCELVPFGDKLALKEALIKVRSDWRKYSRQAREFSQIFDWAPVIQELLGIYQNLDKAPVNNSVSIVIPCHNYGRWLGEAIESALSQSVPCEVIVVDDCSTDNSVEVAERYPVRVIKNESNIGVAETRNKGIEVAKGSFVICLDADDRFRSRDFVKHHLSALSSAGGQVAIAHAPIRLVNDNGDELKRVMFSEKATPGYQTIGRNQIPSCCMFKKEFWQRAGGYDKRYSPAEDAHLWLKIFQLGGTAVMASPTPLMDYRIHGDSLSAKGFPDWWKGSSPNYREPIRERDPKVQIIIESEEEAEAILWLLENQKLQSWSVTTEVKSASRLQRIFPWLNQHPLDRTKSILHLKSLPSSDFLAEYVAQTPAWV